MDESDKQMRYTRFTKEERKKNRYQMEDWEDAQLNGETRERRSEHNGWEEKMDKTHKTLYKRTWNLAPKERKIQFHQEAKTKTA